jgi:transposase
LIPQQQYEYAYIFDAVCPSSGESVGLVLPSSNSEEMNLHLKAISDQVLNNKHAEVIMDNAGCHHAGKLHKFDNITLMYLPPYSPELNQQEQVWRQMRELNFRKLAIRY